MESRNENQYIVVECKKLHEKIAKFHQDCIAKAKELELKNNLKFKGFSDNNSSMRIWHDNYWLALAKEMQHDINSHQAECADFVRTLQDLVADGITKNKDIYIVAGSIQADAMKNYLHHLFAIPFELLQEIKFIDHPSAHMDEKLNATIANGNDKAKVYTNLLFISDDDYSKQRVEHGANLARIMSQRKAPTNYIEYNNIADGLEIRNELNAKYGIDLSHINANAILQQSMTANQAFLLSFTTELEKDINSLEVNYINLQADRMFKGRKHEEDIKRLSTEVSTLIKEARNHLNNHERFVESYKACINKVTSQFTKSANAWIAKNNNTSNPLKLFKKSKYPANIRGYIAYLNDNPSKSHAARLMGTIIAKHLKELDKLDQNSKFTLNLGIDKHGFIEAIKTLQASDNTPKPGKRGSR